MSRSSVQITVCTNGLHTHKGLSLGLPIRAPDAVAPPAATTRPGACSWEGGRRRTGRRGGTSYATSIQEPTQKRGGGRRTQLWSLHPGNTGGEKERKDKGRSQLCTLHPGTRPRGRRGCSRGACYGSSAFQALLTVTAAYVCFCCMAVSALWPLHLMASSYWHFTEIKCDLCRETT